MQPTVECPPESCGQGESLLTCEQASYIGKKVVVAVKAGGDDPHNNLQLAKVWIVAPMQSRAHVQTIPLRVGVV